jgi:ribosomal protein S25
MFKQRIKINTLKTILYQGKIMQKKRNLNKPRTDTGARFAQEFTDEEFIKALKKCMEEATVTADEIAEKVGCNQQVAKRRLLALADSGHIQKKLKGRIWGFRP